MLSSWPLLGALIDPLVLQVPNSVSAVSASYDDGTGAKPLVVTQTSSFPADAFTTVTALPLPALRSVLKGIVRTPDKYCPVTEAASVAICSGVPWLTTCPPCTPAPGPMSNT